MSQHGLVRYGTSAMKHRYQQLSRQIASRTKNGHAPLIQQLCSSDTTTFIRTSRERLDGPDLVRFPALSQIKPHAPRGLVVPFRQFLQVSHLRAYCPRRRVTRNISIVRCGSIPVSWRGATCLLPNRAPLYRYITSQSPPGTVIVPNPREELIPQLTLHTAG